MAERRERDVAARDARIGDRHFACATLADEYCRGRVPIEDLRLAAVLTAHDANDIQRWRSGRRSAAISQRLYGGQRAAHEADATTRFATSPLLSGVALHWLSMRVER